MDLIIHWIRLNFYSLCYVWLAKSIESINQFKKEKNIADDTNYFNYASHVFKPGKFEPVKSYKTRSSPEELQIDMINNDKNLKGNIIEGDIFVINKTEETNSNGTRRVKRSNVINEVDPKTGQPTRWPNKMVVYEFDRALRNYFYIWIISIN